MKKTAAVRRVKVFASTRKFKRNQPKHKKKSLKMVSLVQKSNKFLFYLMTAEFITQFYH